VTLWIGKHEDRLLAAALTHIQTRYTAKHAVLARVCLELLHALHLCRTVGQTLEHHRAFGKGLNRLVGPIGDQKTCTPLSVLIVI